MQNISLFCANNNQMKNIPFHLCMQLIQLNSEKRLYFSKLWLFENQKW